MAFDPKQFLELAKRLFDGAAASATPEADLRTAISRAYFAAFVHALDYAEAFLGYWPQEQSEDHGALRAHLRKRRRSGDANRLEDLRDWRNAADYGKNLSTFGEISELAAEAIAAAERIFLSLTPPQDT